MEIRSWTYSVDIAFIRMVTFMGHMYFWPFFIRRNYIHLNGLNFCLPTWWPLLMPLFLLVHFLAPIWYAIKGTMKRYFMAFMTLIKNMWIGHPIKRLVILNIGNHSFYGRFLFLLVFVVVGFHSLVPFFIFL